MLPRDNVIWSREWTSTMVVATVPLQEKVGNKTVWIPVLLVMGSMLTCRGPPTFFVISLINLLILTNHTVARFVLHVHHQSSATVRWRSPLFQLL